MKDFMKISVMLYILFSQLVFVDPGLTQSWEQINADGFGDPNNTRTTRAVTFNGYLYMGTTNRVTGGEVWQYDGTTWSQVNVDGFGDPNNIEAFSFAVYDSRLYVGVVNITTGCEI